MPADRSSASGSRQLRPSGLHAAFVIGVVAWGAIAFGAVYEWAYRPLAAACLATGVLMIASARERVPPTMVAAFAATVAAALLQQLPLPPEVITRISPATAALLSQYGVGFAFAPAHPLSIDPARTWTGIALLVAFGVFWIGLGARLDAGILRRIVPAILGVGAAIALVGIANARDLSGTVYGWWQPQSHAQPFGPFVNRNHFAGWMLMAIPLGVGSFLDLLSQTDLRHRSWHDRFVWISSPRAGHLLLTGLVLAMMTLSVCLSLSRSGIACLSIALSALAMLAASRLKGGWRRALVPVLAVALVGGCIAWAGIDGVVARFATHADASWAERQAAWRDAASLARQFRWTGTGLNTFGSAMLTAQTTHLDLLFVEAHNDYLQLAAEGGLLLGAPALCLLFVAVRQMRRASSASASWIRVGAQVGLVAVALQECVDFSLQLPGNAALFCVVAAIAMYAPPRTTIRPAVTA